MKAMLLVGGPRDGAVIEMDHLSNTLTVPIPPTHAVWHRETEPIPEPKPLAKALYYKMTFRGESQAHLLYAAQGLSADDVLERLMASYHPWKPTR